MITTSSGDCEKIQYIQLQQCQSGMQFDGNTCSQYTQIAADNGICPEGSTLNLTNSMYCDMVVRELRGQWCEGVNIINGEVCSNSGSDETCRSYNLTYGSCEKRTKTKAAIGCPNGSIDNGVGQCVQTHSYTLNNSCEPGYTLATNNVCTKIEVVPSTPFCDPDFELSGSTCVKSLSQSAASPCGPGFTLNGTGQCMKSEMIQANTTCPSNLYWNGTNCVGSAEPTSWSCGNASYSGKAFWYPPRCYYEYPASGTSCTGDGDYRSGTCYVYIMGTGVVCPNGYVYDNARFCTKTANPTSYSCPDSSWTLSGASCSKYTYSTPSYSCETGYTWNSNTSKCEKNQTAIAQYGCPEGFEADGGACRKPSQRPYLWQCYNDDYPSQWGQGSGMCAHYEPATGEEQCGSSAFVQQGSAGFCVTMIKGENFYCNSGYSWNEQRFECLSSETAQKSYFCPDSSWTLSGQTCTKTDYKDRFTQCPSGWVLNGSNCQYTESREANSKCENGFTSLDDKTCSKSVLAAPIVKCPVGYIDNGTDCVSALTLPAQLKCNAPYLLDEGLKLCKLEQRVPKFN